MNEVLRKILQGYPNGQFNEVELRGLIDEATRDKKEILRLLPPVLTVPFSRWYDTLWYVDWACGRAAEESFAKPPDKEQGARIVKLARAQKESLEKELPH
jgi:hypothetical protein